MDTPYVVKLAIKVQVLVGVFPCSKERNDPTRLTRALDLPVPDDVAATVLARIHVELWWWWCFWLQVPEMPLVPLKIVCF